MADEPSWMPEARRIHNEYLEEQKPQIIEDYLAFLAAWRMYFPEEEPPKNVCGRDLYEAEVARAAQVRESI